MGDKIRVLNMSLAEKNGIKALTSLDEGLEETISWYLNNINNVSLKFNAFNVK
jgi:dTDP-D-glucose 4,6-dehydratase